MGRDRTTCEPSDTLTEIGMIHYDEKFSDRDATPFGLATRNGYHLF